MIRILFLSFILLFVSYPSETIACHISGAEISYRYVGDSTGVSRQYEIILKLYATDITCNTNLPNSYKVCARSSCGFPAFDVTLDLEPGTSNWGHPLPVVNNPCADLLPTDRGLIPKRLYTYTGLTELPGSCEEWRFAFSASCCRTTNTIVNHANLPEVGLHVFATLNNLRGQNSSAQFRMPATSAFCTNEMAILRNEFIENDGDSVVFRFDQVRAATFSCDTAYVFPVFASGFSVEQPFTVEFGEAVHLDKNSGEIIFQAGNMLGNYLYKLVMDEYRYNATLDDYYHIGRSEREVIISALACNNKNTVSHHLLDISHFDNDLSMVPTSILDVFEPFGPFEPFQSDSFTDPNSSTGYSFQWPEVRHSCEDTVITLHLDMPILVESISADGSNFILIGEDTLIYPVIAAYPPAHVNKETTVIKLETHVPFFKLGDYFLFFIGGTNGRSLTTTCLDTIPRHAVVKINVDDCPENLQQNTYTLEEPFVHFFPNPAEDVISIDNLSTIFDTHCTLYDMRGLRIGSYHLKNGERRQISIDQLASGQYILHFKQAGSGKTISQRFVKY